jgi:peptidyl-prolyl cis-trans isomerase C
MITGIIDLMEIVKVDTTTHINRRIARTLLLVAIIWSLSSCKGNSPSPVALTRSVSPTTSNTLTQTVTQTPAPPTPTPEPLAAVVNGEGIPLVVFEAELTQYKAALTAAGKPVPSDADQKKVVLDDLIDQVLLAQAAKEAGYTVTQEELKSRIDQLAANLGSASALAEWEKQNGYDDQSFQISLAQSIAAAWQRDEIVSKVPTTADQVHARQIRVNTETEAQSIMAKLQSGVNFATLAFYYDRDTGGDLGWFPKGYLTVPEVEAAAFSLKVNEYSQIIQSKQGFHIVQVLEIDPNHPLSAEARLVLQKQALTKWMDDRRAQSKITVLVP